MRKLMVCVLVLGCSVPSSGCLILAAGAVVAVKKKKDNELAACETQAAGLELDQTRVVNCDKYNKAK